MTQDTTPEFGTWRSFFWPIYAFELKKIVPMLCMVFCISFNYTILRDTKDTLIVISAGAEALPFLRMWGVLPSAILFMLIYFKLSNILSREQLFYATIIPFLLFFALFPTLLYPNRGFLHPNAWADHLREVAPLGLSGLIESIRNWTCSVFYIVAELWGSVVSSLLFWGFANDITRVPEAKRLYNLFWLGATLSPLVSGLAIIYVSTLGKYLPAGTDAWQVSLNYLMSMVVIAGVAIIAIYYWMNRAVLTGTRFCDSGDVRARKAKLKLSITDSLMYLIRSKYILSLATLVIVYSISINLIEIIWKSQLKLQYPNPNEYFAFMGLFSIVAGVVGTFMLFVGWNVVRRGWGFAAMTTPILLLLTGTGFFVFVLFGDGLSEYIVALGMTPLMLTVIFGAAQKIMSESAKCSLFVPTKEMAYIPLDPEAKVKGKAAVDVVGAYLGRSGGSFIQLALLSTCGTISASTPYVALIFFAIIVFWILAVRSLDRQFTQMTQEPVRQCAT